MSSVGPVERRLWDSVSTGDYVLNQALYGLARAVDATISEMQQEIERIRTENAQLSSLIQRTEEERERSNERPSGD